jgi:predicted ATPase
MCLFAYLFFFLGADSASIRILQHVHEQCQRVLLVLATRPVKDYNVTFIKNFRETGTSEEIKLNGLSATEIGEIILQTFQTTGVTSVSPEIVRVIQKRTAGNPLYVKYGLLSLIAINN